MTVGAHPPQRVVSLVPSATESVCVLAGVERLVGRTRYCVEPAGRLEHVRAVGGTKNPDREAVLAQRPDLVLANAEENRPEDLEWLAARVPTMVQTPRTVDEARRDLAALAARLGAEEEAAPILAAIDERRARAARVVASDRPRVYYAIWRKPWMTVGVDTFVHDVLVVAGARGVAADGGARYPALEPEEACARGVDLVLLASEPWEFDRAQRDEIVAAGRFADVPVALCDGRDFCWHGVRMATGLARAAEVIRSALPA